MDLGLTGRRAVVAAASSGLGYAAAASLVSEGANVVICGSDAERARAAAERLGPNADWVTADLSVPEACEQFVVEAEDKLGGVDILVANGPGPPPGRFADTPTVAYARAVELNLLSVVRMCTAAVPGMRSRGWGRIVAITSVAVRQPIPNLILSNTARAGATGFLKTLALEVAADGVTVNSVQPGMHDTERLRNVYGGRLAEQVEQIPAGKAGRPADFGDVLTFLCSDQAGFVTGAALPVDGGAYLGLQ